MHDKLKVRYLAHAPRGESILIFFVGYFRSKKLPSFEETLNLTFGCLEKKGFSTAFTLYEICMS